MFPIIDGIIDLMPDIENDKDLLLKKNSVGIRLRTKGLAR